MTTINPYQAPDLIDEPDPAAPVDPTASPYASRWLRLGGAVLDALFAGIPLQLIFYLTNMNELAKTGRMPLALLSLCGVAMFLLLNGALIYHRGQTLGKLICGTVVVTRDFRRVSGNRYVFLRYLPVVLIGQIPVLGVIFGVADSLAIFRREKNCLHDDIAGTRVIMRKDLAE